ncbi:tRNA-dihydrouridine synthase [Pseudaquabacterium pictum]|uniref:tRNA-dihydrouridine(16) synthase n=1 Tax=Pseudaquabacterium pictum TaxID=2315236 RepID=A0A480AK02_9BURK|nr:tRNA-dihydrouridine synthase [Rubrivivax pictus]GCL62059.1 tRNA-dihydrouridine(16) synthase [Rubrivivax pictus]
MTILLAPMEGLLDHPLREVLTAVGGIDRCVTEFIRITDQLLPEKVFTRVMPELRHGSRTRAGTPVRAQLLGSDPACLADNAARLAELGAEGIDLNFGCPAKTVNRHRGGAVLLDEPDLLHDILAAVRRAVPAHLPVSAKMRLGHRDDDGRIDAAQALAAGGAGELVVHARTKLQGYRPPAFWHKVADIRAAVAIPVIANGEIWTVADAQRARAESGCHGLMLGRGQVADPGLAWALRAADGAPPHLVTWAELLPGLARFWDLVALQAAPRHRAGRLKQWLNLLRRRYPEAQAAFDTVRPITDPAAVQAALFGPAAPVRAG